MKVFTYPGIQNLPADFNYDNFLEFDVILATYPVLSKEVYYARPPPDRSMRYKKIRPPRRSPLMEFQWWRVCLDEAQMIEGSVTSAATVACMLPRTVSPQNETTYLNRMLGAYREHRAKKTSRTCMDCSYSFNTTPSLAMCLCGHDFVKTGTISTKYSFLWSVVIPNIR